MRVLKVMLLFCSFASAQLSVMGGHAIAGGNAILGSSGSSALIPGWQFVQEFTPNPCSGSSCTTPADCSSVNCLVPVTIGDVVIVTLIAGNNNVTISSVTGAGTGWTNAGCQAFNSGNDNLDVEYTLSATTNFQQLTANFSGAISAGGYLDIMELRPPLGHAAVFDACAHNAHTTCSASCLGGAPTVTGTDMIVQFYGGGTTVPLNPNSWTAPYQGTLEGTGLCINCTSGSAPTVGMAASSTMNIDAIAFKTDAGLFTPPTPIFSIVNYSLPTFPTPANCSPTCNITITSTGTGHLMFVTEIDSAGAGNNTMAITGYTAPAGCHKNGATGNWEANCAYLLSSSSGVTSLPVTFSGNVATAFFAVWEIAKIGGGITLDTVASTLNAGAANFMPQGQVLTLANNSPHVTFQAIAASGGVDGATFYPFPWFDGVPNGTALGTNGNSGSSASNAVLLNDTVGQRPVWPFPGTTSAVSTAVFGASFQ